MIDDNDLVVVARAEAGIDSPIHAEIGPDRVALADRVPPLVDFRPLESELRPNNRHEPAARLEPQERLLDVPGAERTVVSAHPAAGGGKRRVHHHGVIGLLGRQQVIEPLGVESRRLEALQHEQMLAPDVDLIRIHMGPGQAGHDGNVARPCARFQGGHPHAKPCGADHQQCLSMRSAELLKLDLRLVPGVLPRQA